MLRHVRETQLRHATCVLACMICAINKPIKQLPQDDMRESALERFPRDVGRTHSDRWGIECRRLYALM
jgi:hypothetical protein